MQSVSFLLPSCQHMANPEYLLTCIVIHFRYALTWLLPSGNLLIQSNLKAEIFDWQNNIEQPLPDIPHSVRVYPASGATAMLPLTPANNWTATILFCGGTDLQPNQWMTNPNWNVAAYPADDTCVSITPDVSSEWVEEGESDYLFIGDSLGMFDEADEIPFDCLISFHHVIITAIS